MKPLSLVVPLAFVAGVALSLPSLAQQPAGSTGVCKDGSYTSAENKRGACRGHGGVKDWYATAKTEKSAPSEKAEKSSKTAKTEKSSSAKPDKSAMTTPATTMPAATPSPSTARTDKMASTSRTPKGMRTEAAPGGGAGKVWLNTATNTYHCSSDQWYGKTKAGEYMSESEAKAKGGHAARGKACG
ncbi:MAG TPA: DUF3761 domain-containing protein [Casimicrobiaceae bacterium]